MQNNERNNTREADIEMLREMLEQELQKPEGEWDYDRIDALSAAVMDESMTQEQQEQAIRQGLDRTLRVCAAKRTPIFRRSWVRRIAAACACAAMLFGVNSWMLHATGVGILKHVYTFFDRSVVLEFSDEDKQTKSLDIAQSEDPFGIRSECEKYGFSPLVPQYRPEGFETEYINHDETDEEQYLDFYYRNAKKQIIIIYRYYEDADAVPMQGWGIPSDTHNVSELELQGVTVTVSKEDQQYKAMFLLNNTVYYFGTHNLDPAEAEHILCSMFG